MSLVRFDEVALEFGDQVLLRNASMSIEPGERVCLIGRNGAGKTSLFRLITGELETDQGEIYHRPGIGISQLKQTLPDDLDRTVREVVSDGLAEASALANQYRQLSERAGDAHSLRELETLHQQIDARGGWNI
ncbi:MAG: ATP-binding cassette domain-containing protein, partial [Gammaproteobacteria bacterium]